MGEAKNGALKLQFDGHLRLEFRGAKVTTDAGLLAVRELDEALKLTKMTVRRGYDREYPDLNIFRILDGWTKCSQRQAWGLNAEDVKEEGCYGGHQIHGILCNDPLLKKLESQI